MCWSACVFLSAAGVVNFTDVGRVFCPVHGVPKIGALVGADLQVAGP